MEWLYGLALLACPVGMGAMMWFMSKGMRGGDKKVEDAPHAETASVESLREQQHRLAADVARLEENDTAVHESQPAAKR